MAGRKTNNSLKAAGSHNNKPMDSGNTTKSPPQLNQGFLEKNSSVFTMASMEQVVNGKFLNEAFENLSTDEKLSLILTELCKMGSSLTALQRSSSSLKQQVDTHEAELRSGKDVTSDKITDMDRQVEVNNNDIVDIYNAHHDIYERAAKVEDSVTKNTSDINTLKGLVERQSKQIHINQKKITDLTTRSMDHNFTISGLPETKDENCTMVVTEFLRLQMGITDTQDDIHVAHRMGVRQHGRSRLMVIAVSSKLKKQIIPNTHKLKGKQNEHGQPFFVNVQIPEAVAAERKAIQYEVKKVKDFNETRRPGESKKQFQVKNKKLYINDKLHEQKVLPPRPLDIFVSTEDQRYMDAIDFTISKPRTQNLSQFIGLATKVQTIDQVQAAYRKVRQMYPSYDHAMMAYKLSDEDEGYQDDGEHASGMKIQTSILERRCSSIALFVVRNFGGIHIGPQRFDCILEVANQAMEALIREHPEIVRNVPWAVALGNDEAGDQQDQTVQDRLQQLAQPEQTIPNN